MVLTEEGYITNIAGTPVYHYYLKDHQGNNRVVIDQSGAVEQVNHYYPFGGLFGDNTGGDAQPYKYNGKELGRMHGLDLFDYGARHYDAAIGRWGTVDPLAEKYYSVSPYVYCADNPVRFIDPDGRDILLWNYVRSDKVINKLSPKMNNSLSHFIKTKDGNAFISQFAKKNDNIAGHSFDKNGALSDKTLNIVEVSYSEETANLIPINDGDYVIEADKNQVTIYIDTSGGLSKESITETIMHESLVHGNDIDKQFKGAKIDGDKDHKALRDKDSKHSGYRKYDSARKELEHNSEKYKKAFEESDEKYRRIYKDLK